jgi:hypothetical protein
MTKNGCGFVNGICGVVIDKCEGCGKIIDFESGNIARFTRIRQANG